MAKLKHVAAGAVAITTVSTYILSALLSSLGVWFLWNYVGPPVFGAPALSLLQVIALYGLATLIAQLFKR